jgi:hypothetical protein
MIQAFRFAAAAFAMLACAGTALAQNPPQYRVKDVAIDKTADTAANAVLQGQAEARYAAAERLIKRFTLPEDRAAARTPPDPGAIARLYKSQDFQVADKRTATRYIAVMAFNFDPKAVREYLDGAHLPFVDTQAGQAMIAPVAGSGVNPIEWAAIWKGRNDDTSLTPYVVSQSAYDHTPTWAEVAQEAGAAGALRSVAVEASNQGGQYYVKLTDVRSGAPDAALGSAGPFPDLAAAMAGAVEAMENAWKEQTVVRSTGSNGMSLVAYFQDVGQWVKIQKGIESSRMISGLKIESVSTAGADLSFSFAGRPDQLAADLRARGLDLRGSDRGYTLQTLGTQ